MSFNIGKMMKQVQDMQKNMAEMRKKMEDTEYEGNSGGDAVKVVVSGNGFVKSVKINPNVIDPSDPEMLEDLIIAAVNDAKKRADETSENMVSGMMGGLSLPPGFKFPF
ncbi:MAG: YbaB/EbfC family nucleoid-associated protein [Alphaproteobacteria bacterium]|nr:YbaB/EbfC family nucleoid-associated protein [Alphaproteobacteria bacterium]OJV12186.1 MAG: YbaB/EbfC family nucleoid-associated protein [Alphaproteobacteria bacterium 33-17]